MLWISEMSWISETSDFSSHFSCTAFRLKSFELDAMCSSQWWQVFRRNLLPPECRILCFNPECHSIKFYIYKFHIFLWQKWNQTYYRKISSWIRYLHFVFRQIGIQVEFSGTIIYAVLSPILPFLLRLCVFEKIRWK